MRPSRFNPIRTVEGFGSEVFPQPYHIPATPTPRRMGPVVEALNAVDAIRAACHFGRRASKHARMPTPSPRTCPVTVGVSFRVHSECETPAGRFQPGPRVRHRVAPAQSPPGALRIREMLRQGRRWCAPRESVPDSSELCMVPMHALALVPPPSGPTTSTRPY